MFKRKRIFPIFSFALLLIPLLLLQGCSNKPEEQNMGSAAHRGPAAGRTLGLRGAGERRLAEAIPVEVASPWRTDLSSYVFGNTHIEALREVEIIGRVQGLLQQLRVEEGDRVKKGQVLAELDKTELRISRREAAARLENNRSIYQRALKMLEQQLTSQETLDNSKYLHETAKTQLEQAELNLQYATITSPFSGVITSRLVDQGEMIRVGTVMFLLADMDKLLARVYVPEKELARIALDNRVRLESEMFPGETFGGLVEMISPVVDPTTGTIKVTVRVSEARDKLKPGMFCSTYILTEIHENSLAISRKALVPDVEDTQVYVVEDGRVVRLRKITVGIEQGDTLEVLTGLEDGDQVVLVGKEALRDGSPVRLIIPEPAGESSAPLPEKPRPHGKAVRAADGPRTR